MSTISFDTILIINEGGLPIFHYDKSKSDLESADHYILESGFFAAINQFAAEMGDEDVRYIVFDQTRFILKKALSTMVVFSNKSIINLNDLVLIEQKVASVAINIENIMKKHGLTGDETLQPEIIDKLVMDLTDFLKGKNFIDQDVEIDAVKNRKAIQKAIFKTVGYQPGVCNIGPAERMRRLLYGVTGLLASVIGLIFLMYLETLNPEIFIKEFRFILVVPLFFSFQGFYQYFFKFCVTNALKKQFQMN